MHIIRETEKDTQKRVIEFFQDALNYTYLGNWADSVDENSNIIPEDLADWLRKQNPDPNIIAKAVYQLQQAAKIGGSRTLYDANFDVYELLRYGAKVRPDVSEHHKTVRLIDWKNPENNDFGIAEEVAVSGKNSKRPGRDLLKTNRNTIPPEKCSPHILTSHQIQRCIRLTNLNKR